MTGFALGTVVADLGKACVTGFAVEEAVCTDCIFVIAAVRGTLASCFLMAFLLRWVAHNPDDYVTSTVAVEASKTQKMTQLGRYLSLRPVA